MKRILRDLLGITVIAMLTIMPTAALALEWVQIGRVSGDVVCGNLETGIGDRPLPDRLRFHRYSKFMAGSNVQDRIQVQRGSKIAVRLLGHGADLFPSLQEEISGVTASVTTQGRYFHHPNASGPMGFVEVRIDVRDNAELGKNSVFVQWPTGRERIPLMIVRNCEQTGEVPTTAVPKDPDRKCFGAGGSNCGAPLPLFGLNPSAACSGGLCLYSGGSWTHDECCARNPSGHACGGPETFVSGESLCRAQMNLALSRAANGFSWHRDTNFSKVNADGRVVARDACAPSGTIVHRDDERFCCARLGVTLNPSATERNKSVLNPMVKGYATKGAAQFIIPPSGVACE